MKKFAGLILFLIAIALKTILFPFLFIYGIVKSIKTKTFEVYCLDIAESIDRFGNVVGQYVWNDILITKGGYQAGNPKETISSFLGKNSLRGTLSLVGKALANLLNFIQKNHCINSVDPNV